MALVHPARFYLDIGSPRLNVSEITPNLSSFFTEEEGGPVVVNFWLDLFLIMVISVPGIFINFATAFVLFRPQLRSPIHILFAGLALLDVLILILALLIFPNVYHCFRVSVGCTFYNNFSFFSYPFTQVLFFSAIWTCVIIVMDRFFLIFYPLRRRNFMTVKAASCILVIIFTLALLYSIPSALELGLNEGGLTDAEIRFSPVYRQVYRTVLYVLIFLFLPWFFAIIFGFLDARAVHKAKNDRKKATLNTTTTAEQKEQKSTIAALVVVGIFLIVNLMGTCNIMLANGSPISHFGPLISIGNVLVCLNCTTRFLAYWFILPNFKHIFVSTFFPCITKYLSAQYQYSGYYGNTNGETFGIIAMRTIQKKQTLGNRRQENLPAMVEQVDCPLLDGN